jgi:hypothetical protein
MDTITLDEIIGAIVEICTFTIMRDEETITGEQIEAALIERFPTIPRSLMPLAFPRAAAILRAQAKRDHEHAEELRQYLDARRKARAQKG